MNVILVLLRLGLALSACLFLPAPRAVAQSTDSGSISGRLPNVHSGTYLEGARVTVTGTALETFTDDTGVFLLTDVPVGPVQLRVFFTGFEPRVETVVVTAGATATRDITLGAPAAASSGPVKLNQFVVATTREMDGAALAINEQRFSSSIKNVVSTEEYGNVAEGNAAEFIKFMPGVTIDYTGGNARDISINGVPSAFVPVTVDGFSVATASTGGSSSRAVQSDMISINNLSRIEVNYSPTPES